MTSRAALLAVALVACRENPSKLDGVAAAKPAASTKPAFPTTFEADAVDVWVAAEMAERGAVGMSLVVIEGGKVVLAKGYGKARGDGNELVTADTPFALGSVSKQFLCTAAYMLVDKGQLAMTDSIAKWYPNATRAADITLADLGGHTAGYRDYYPLDYVDTRMQKPIAPDDLIAQYAAMPLDFEPRARWSYSNTGFVLLARVVEKVSGVPYSKLLEEQIWKPLGMTASITRPATAASGHVSFLLDGAKPAPFEAEGWLFGAGDIWASANDVAKWDLALLDGKLLSPESHRALATARMLANGKSSGYSCGWYVGMNRNELVLQHGGWVGGFHTRNVIVPRTKSAVIVLTNDEYANVTGIADKILGLLTAELAAPIVSGPPAGEAARDHILELQRGALDRGKLGEDLSAYYDDARVAAAAAKLRALGPPTVTVTSRDERGALEVTHLSIAFPSKTFNATMFRSPDGKIRQLLFEN
ncbi:MAG: beta-lactamase family protein [Myxococcota bacterium]|nr:beta-lactamase family protein [Deltaproteobacteria bacterium]MDQ3333753.1 beta-lactamase family protein [Myxococcota bacterium]